MVFFFKQKTAYEMRISDWSSDVCSSDLPGAIDRNGYGIGAAQPKIEPLSASPRGIDRLCHTDRGRPGTRRGRGTGRVAALLRRRFACCPHAPNPTAARLSLPSRPHPPSPYPPSSASPTLPTPPPLTTPPPSPPPTLLSSPSSPPPF